MDELSLCYWTKGINKKCGRIQRNYGEEDIVILFGQKKGSQHGS